MVLKSDLRVLLTLTLLGFFLGENNLRGSQASTAQSTLTKDGDIIIEGMFAITNSQGKLSHSTAMVTEAMIFTIDMINKNRDILPTIELGYEIFDDKGEDLQQIMGQAIKIVSKHRPRSVCRDDEEFCTKDDESSPLSKRISAVIGPATSGNTVPVASLLGLYSIPQVGYSASSSLLSDKSRFKSFLRTIPSDEYQTKAMASFIKYHGWNYVFFVANDDEYGRQGLASFKNAARELGVCTADDINIAFQRDVDSDKEVNTTLHEIKKDDRARVVILFMYQSQAAKVLRVAKREGIENITWIVSDAVGLGILNYNVSKESLDGAIAVGFNGKKVEDFERHLKNITVKASKRNSWMVRLLEETLNCSTASLPAAGYRQCRDDEKLNLSGIGNSSSMFMNVINGVKAIATGLHNLMNCTNGTGLLKGGHCPNTTGFINGKDLYLYIRNATFVGATGETVGFDEYGDLITKEYKFRNFVYNREEDKLDFDPIAMWSSKSPDAPTFLSGKDVAWKGGKKPESTCSQVCKPGWKQVGQSVCCWACELCPKGEVSYNESAKNCTRCPEGYYANAERTNCLRIGVDFIEASDPFAAIIITISCLGLVAMFLVALMFTYVRATPLIQDSGEIFLGLFVLSTVLAFIFSIFQVTLYRTDSACRFLTALLLYVVVLLSSTLLAKTKTCDNQLRKFTSHYIKPTTQYGGLIMIATALLFQLLLIGVWYLVDSPTVHMVRETEAMQIRECKSSWSAPTLVSFGFPLALLLMATAFSFKERDNRENHSEAKYLSFCTISLCIVLIAFFPTYRFVKGVTLSVVIATTAVVGAFAVIGCIILPKVYILIFRPERNVPGHEHSKEPTVSSAHTAGSHPGSSSQPEFAQCAETGEEVRTPNDVELVSPSSSSSQSPKKDAPKNEDIDVK